jgi:hypothetical protein
MWWTLKRVIAPSKVSSGTSRAVASPSSKATFSTPAAAASERALLDHRRRQVAALYRADPWRHRTRDQPWPAGELRPPRLGIGGDEVDHRVERLGEAHRRTAREGVGLVGELLAD